MRGLTVFLFLFHFFCLKAQSIVDTLQTNHLNQVSAVYQLHNNKYLVAGTETDFNSDWGYIGVIRNGNFLWYNKIEKWSRGSISEVIFDKADSTFLLSYSIGDTAEFNFGLRKLDINGNTIWDKFYGFGPNNAYPSRINKYNAGYTMGFYVHGISKKFSRLCVLDSLGDTVKTFLPPPLQNDSTAKIVGYLELANGNKVVAFNPTVLNQMPKKGQVTFYDSNWNTIHSKSINSGEFSFLQVADNYVFAAGKYTTGNNPGATVLQAFDFSGNNTFSATDTCYVCFPQQILPLSNGQYVFAIGGNGLFEVRSKLVFYNSAGKVVVANGFQDMTIRHVSENIKGQLDIAAGLYQNNTFYRTIWLSSVVNSFNTTNAGAYAFPNPSQSILNLALSKEFQNVDREVIITDASGVIIKAFTLNSSEFQIDIEALNPGMYFLKMQNNAGESAAIKFLKM